jgi:hypothetical protein
MRVEIDAVHQTLVWFDSMAEIHLVRKGGAYDCSLTRRINTKVSSIPSSNRPSAAHLVSCASRRPA